MDFNQITDVSVRSEGRILLNIQVSEEAFLSTKL